MFGRLLEKLSAACAVFLSVGIVAAIANYAVTQGSGTNFGSIVVGGVHYAQQFICDLTTPAQCASVSAGGALSVNVGTSGLPSGASTEATLSTLSGKLPTSLTTAGADGVSNTLSGLQGYSRLQMYNGTTWDRVLGDTTNGMWVNVKNTNANLATNADAIAAVAAGAAGAGSPVNSAGYVYNGTTWDRMPGTTAGVTVRSPTAANLNATVVGTGTFATQATGTLATAGGWTPLKLAALTNTAVAIKASAGQLGKLYCYNPNATVAYIQVYNVAAGSVTVGTTAALQSYGIPPTNSSGFVLALVGDQYGTAMSAAATTTAGGGTAPGTAVDCNVSYN